MMSSIDIVKQNEACGFNTEVSHGVLDADETDMSLDGESAALAEDAAKVATSAVDRNVSKAREKDALTDFVRSSNLSLVERARRLATGQAFEFPETEMRKSGENIVHKVVNCDLNRFEFFRAMFGEGDQRPHFDEFKGRVVDHDGKIIDDHYSVIDLVAAMNAASLKGQSARMVRESLKEYALKVKRNDIIDRVSRVIPEWDGVPRLETALLKLFRPHDTDLNRSMSRYFFLSLYARIMHPGSFAPIVLSLIGGQAAGKSYFSKLICEEILDDKEADSVSLELDGGQNEFLRNITGQSVIAQIGEMTGFNRADMNRIKNFITKSTDTMHHKFEGSIQQARQWIIVMDGNKYEGIQRDDTGNRRFYPMFVGQIDHENGIPQWDVEFRVDYTDFRREFWQVMAEAQAEYRRMGANGYQKFVNETSEKVRQFSADERSRNSGTSRNTALEVHLADTLAAVFADDRKFWDKRGRKESKAGAAFRLSDFSAIFKIRSGEIVNFDQLKPAMSAIGATYVKNVGNNRPGYVFYGKTVEDLRSEYPVGIEENYHDF